MSFSEVFEGFQSSGQRERDRAHIRRLQSTHDPSVAMTKHKTRHSTSSAPDNTHMETASRRSGSSTPKRGASLRSNSPPAEDLNHDDGDEVIERRATRSSLKVSPELTRRTRSTGGAVVSPLVSDRPARTTPAGRRRKSNASPVVQPATPSSTVEIQDDEEEDDGDESEDSPKVEPLLANRPKRQIIPKSYETTAGISWREETEIQRALLASLHHSKTKGLESAAASSSKPGSGGENSPAASSSTNSKADSASSFDFIKPSNGHHTPPVVDSQAVEQKPKNLLFKSHVRAQRKFAQGSRPSSPSVSPMKEPSSSGRTPVKHGLSSSKSNNLPLKPTAKTEDFITFLCLRGTPYLPPHLEFFNYCESEALVSCPTTPKSSRPATPANGGPGAGGDHGAGKASWSRNAMSIRGRSVSSGQPSRACTPEPAVTGEEVPIRALNLEGGNSSSSKAAISRSSSAKSLHKNLKQARVNITSLPTPLDKSHKRKIYQIGGDHDHDDDFAPEKTPSVPLKKLRVATNKSIPVKTTRNLQHERGKKLVKKAIEQSKKSAANGGGGGKPGIMTRRKRQEIEVKQFEQAKAASAGYESSSSDVIYIPDGGVKSKRRDERNDSETSSYSTTTKSKKNKKKKKKKRRSEDDDDMIYLYMSFEEPESPGKQSKAQKHQEEVEGTRSSRMSRSRSASVVTAVTDMADERASTSASQDHHGGGKGKGQGKASIPLPRHPVLAPFPSPSGPAHIVTAPVYHPTPEQFNADPLTYIAGLREGGVEGYGMCRVIPPAGWKPDCQVPSELRFTTQNQYIHKMMHRWGPNIKKMECIRKHLETQGHYMKEPPSIGRLELDLPALSAAVEACGGMQTVQDDKKKWNRIADMLNIPTRLRPADRTSKLYDAYCKCLLSYDTLTQQEKDHIASHVDYVWSRQKHAVDGDCVSKGQSRSLSEFFRIASNLQAMYFGEEEQDLSREQVEDKYWEILSKRDKHVCVQYVHVDTENCGSAFPNHSTDPLSKHGWNFNQIEQNPGSVLRHLGPVNGVTIPELHIGMLFSTNCWSADPHALPYITYLHTGADIVWYSVPKSEESKFKKVLEELNPDLVDLDSPVWLSIDSIMVSPEVLRERGVSVSVTVQRQGEFVLVFPHAYTATLCCGYNIAESIRYAPVDWIPLGYKMAEILYESCEGELFSMERLLLKLARNDSTPIDTLSVSLPCLEPIIANELRLRRKLREAGLTQMERMQCASSPSSTTDNKHKGGASSHHKTTHHQDNDSYYAVDDEDNRCDNSKKICYLSMVVNVVEREVYSLEHAVEHIQKKEESPSV